jgi:hypothetical protein
MDGIDLWLLLLGFFIICLVFRYYDYELLIIMYEIESILALAPSYTSLPSMVKHTSSER